MVTAHLAGGRCIARAIFGFICGTVLSVSVAAPRTPMGVDGRLIATNTGGIAYTQPIEVPPGVAGLEPKLAMVYNSQGGDGLFGVGWSLAGLSVISRCPQTRAQDGNAWVGATTYSATDRFCLDGQRLQAVPNPDNGAIAGTYGLDQTYYATERENFSKIQSIGSQGAGLGPTSFKVWLKSGHVMEYGFSVDSRVLAVGKSAVRIWALNKVTDVHGNSMTFEYSGHSVHGDYIPTFIKYGSPSSPITIEFEAANINTLSNSKEIYVGGSVLRKTRYIKSVKMPGGAYNFNYKDSPNTLRRMLTSIEVCASSCVVSSFDWAASAKDPAITRMETKGGGFWDAQKWMVADVNGDGFSDVVNIFDNNGSVAIDVHVNQKNGTLVPSRWISDGVPYSTSGNFLIADANGDGRLDIIYTRRSGMFNQLITLLLSMNSSFVAQPPLANGVFSGGGINSDWHVGDVNGDGFVDVVGINKIGGVVAIDVLVNQQNGTFVSSRWISDGGGYPGLDKFFVADVNGDGRADVIHLFSDAGASSVDFLISTGEAFSYPVRAVTKSGPYLAEQVWQVADVNGDGLADLIKIYAETATEETSSRLDHLTGLTLDAHVNTGANILLPQIWARSLAGYLVYRYDKIVMNPQYREIHFSLSYPAIHVADVNADGRSDLIVVASYKNQIYVTPFFSNSQGVVPVYNVPMHGAYSAEQRWLVGDANGDGSQGLFKVFNDAGSATIDSNEVPVMVRDSITKFKTGLSTFVPTYGPPASNNLYTLGLSASLPLVDFIPNFWLVSQIESDNGIGGKATTSYRYGNARAEIGTGRGFMGFGWVQSKDDTTGLVNRTHYLQSWPFTGQVAKIEMGTSESSKNDLGTKAFEYGCMDFVSSSGCTVQAGRRYFVYPTKVESTGNKDVNAQGQPGTALPGQRVVFDMDIWGNVLKETEEALNSDGTLSGFKKVILNDYSPVDTGKWHLGRLLRRRTEVTTP